MELNGGILKSIWQNLSRIWQPCISVKIGGDQDFSDFILFYNIRCLDDINMNRERKVGVWRRQSENDSPILTVFGKINFTYDG